MKKTKLIFYAVAALLATPFISFSQEKASSYAMVLSKYDDLKNALVKSDAGAASKSAGEFATLVKGIDVNTLATGEQGSFQSLKGKLIADANIIASTKDLAKQRSAFQSLSENVIAVTKTGKPAKPVYVAYCPMKKAYWLSTEQTIRNPYYGNSMLTCGKVSETIN